MKKTIIYAFFAFTVLSISSCRSSRNSYYNPDVSYVETSTHPTFEDPASGKVYKYVEIGKQTWMAENKASSGDYESYTYASKCPDGWRLPYIDDWFFLIKEFGGIESTLSSLRDPYGFNAQAMGYFWSTEDYAYRENNAYFWFDGNYAHPDPDHDQNYFHHRGYIKFDFSANTIEKSYLNKTDGFTSDGRIDGRGYIQMPCRCIKNSSPLCEVSYSNISPTSFEAFVSFPSNGGSNITESGLVWDTLPYPTKEKRYHITGNDGKDESVKLKKLKPGTKMYVRAYAINEFGIGYSNNVEVNLLNESNLVGTWELVSIDNQEVVNRDDKEIIAFSQASDENKYNGLIYNGDPDQFNNEDIGEVEQEGKEKAMLNYFDWKLNEQGDKPLYMDFDITTVRSGIIYEYPFSYGIHGWNYDSLILIRDKTGVEQDNHIWQIRGYNNDTKTKEYRVYKRIE